MVTIECHNFQTIPIQWTPKLDEMLLRLLKCLPSQWETVANMIGCSAIQCSDRHEKFSDSFLATGGNYEPDDDHVKIHLVEIDPPVTVDMRSQARYRLVVTRAKKTNRKARELELARRHLATWN